MSVLTLDVQKDSNMQQKRIILSYTHGTLFIQSQLTHAVVIMRDSCVRVWTISH